MPCRFGMRHLLYASVFVPLRFYSILLLKAEVKVIYVFDKFWSNSTINLVRRVEKMRK